MKVIFTNGCFDILHRGHLELLKYCKSMGYVIVGLNSDTSVRRLKGQNKPFNTEEDRKFLLESLKFVDEVHVFNEETPYTLISTLKPDIIVKGGNYESAEVVGNDIAEVRIFNFIDGYSTTKTIQSFIDRR